MSDGVPTLGETTSRDSEVRSSRARLAFGIALGLVLVAALVGLFGVRSASRSATSDGYRLDVDYIRISRSGLSGSVGMTLTHPGGFPADGVRVALSHDYVSALADVDVTPSPDSSTTVGDLLVWEFDPPSGDTFEVHLDGNFHPSIQWKRAASAAVLDDDGAPIVTVHFTTTVLP